VIEEGLFFPSISSPERKSKDSLRSILGGAGPAITKPATAYTFSATGERHSVTSDKPNPPEFTKISLSRPPAAIDRIDRQFARS